MSHPLCKLLSQNVTVGAVRLRPARFCMFQYHPMRETYKHPFLIKTTIGKPSQQWCNKDKALTDLC